MLISIRANAGFLRRPWWNCLSSSAITRQAVFATALALRGEWVIEAISAKMTLPGAIFSGLPATLKNSSATAGL